MSAPVDAISENPSPMLSAIMDAVDTAIQSGEAIMPVAAGHDRECAMALCNERMAAVGYTPFSRSNVMHSDAVVAYANDDCVIEITFATPRSTCAARFGP